MKPTVRVLRSSIAETLQTNLRKVGKKAVYVGIPAATAAERSAQLLQMAASAPAKASKRKQQLVQAASEDVNNAELLWIFSKGSPLRGIPARPVLEPAIAADGNKQKIGRELATAASGAMHGDDAAEQNGLNRAGMAGQNAAKAWFTDPRNGWAPNAESTVQQKGSDRPGIDTDAMRNAITYVTREE